MESVYETEAALLREYLRCAEMSDEEFGRRLKKGDPAAAIVFAASRLAAEIGNVAAEIVRNMDNLTGR